MLSLICRRVASAHRLHYQRHQIRLMASTTSKAAKEKPTPRRIKVYTKTGDKGTSMLYSGERRPKDDLIFDALGACDELNASVGVSREYAVMPLGKLNGEPTPGLIALADQLEQVMSRLFDVGGAVATPQSSASDAKVRRTEFGEGHAKTLETWIDQMDAELPPLRNFILPSGGFCSVHLQQARTLARRAERRVVPLVRGGDCEKSVGVYLNRLSDYLFVAARFAAKECGQPEKIWTKHREPKAKPDAAAAAPPPAGADD